MDRIAAGIISYNPEIDRLVANITVILRQVEHIYIFDNNSRNIDDIRNAVKTFANVSLKAAHKNMGLGYGLNKIMEMALIDGFTWVLSLDQDSVLQKDAVEKFKAVTGDEKIVIVCPYVVDDRRKYMKYEYEKDLEEIEFCITSGSMTNLKIWSDVGKFDDWLFIDLIDNDYCKRIRIYGYKILRVNTVLMNQEFGKIVPKSKNVIDFYVKLGKMLHNTNIQKLSYKKIIDPTRVYYTCRNVLYLNKKFENYGGIGYDNYHCKNFVGFLLYFCFGSVVRSKGKILTLKKCIRGFREGKEKAKHTEHLLVSGKNEV